MNNPSVPGKSTCVSLCLCQEQTDWSFYNSLFSMVNSNDINLKFCKPFFIFKNVRWQMLNTNKPHWQNILQTYKKDYVLFTSFQQPYHCKTCTRNAPAGYL